MKSAIKAVRAFLASKHPIKKTVQKMEDEVEKGIAAGAARKFRKPTGKEEAQMVQYQKLMARAWCWFVEVKRFPDTPWLELTQEERTDCQRQHQAETGMNVDLHSRALADDVIAAQSTDNWRTWCSARKDNVSGWFSIPRAQFTKEQVLSAFELALDDLSFANNDLLLRFGSRGGPADQLRQLGALRLMKGRTATKAMEIFYLHPQKGKEYLYHRSTAIWYAARKAAREQIEEIDAEAERLCELLEETRNFK